MIGAPAENGFERIRDGEWLAPEPTADLLERVAAGEVAALGELYETQAEGVYELAYMLTGSVSDAEDIVHDLFIGLPEAVDSLEADVSFRPWFRKCALRASLQHLRIAKRRREVRVDPDWLAGSTPPPLENIDLASALDMLPGKLRVVLVMKDLEGYRHAEIGRLLGISAAASRVRMMRARQMLRRLLGPLSADLGG